MACGITLVNEIYDQFLVCKICFEAFKNPKTLTCQHTFCRDCLAKHHEAEQERCHGYRFQTRSVTCPVCRKRTDLPVGGISKLSDNFLVSNLCEVVERRRSSKPKSAVADCDICRPTQLAAGVRTRSASKDPQAHFRCLDCSKMLCRRCADLHRRTKVTQDHGLFVVDVQSRDIQCRVHHDETIRFYCEPCDVCICVLCTFQDHKDHEVYTFSEGIERHGHSLDTLLERSRGRCGRLRDQIDLIGRCEAGIRAAEEYIRETAMDWVRQIRQQERQILHDLEQLASDKAREFIQQKAALQETLEALESTCNLTEIVIRDRSVELLLLKDEINVKLNKLLAEGKILPPPDIVTRPVAFVPGTCFLGRLDFVEQYAGDFSPQHFQPMKTKRTEETNQDALSSCVERSMEEESKNTAGNGNNNCPGVKRKPNFHADEQQDLAGIQSTETSTFRSKNCKFDGSKGKSKSAVQTSSASLHCRDICQRNNKNSLSCADRSTVTTRLLDSHCDKVLDTDGLIRTRDSTTQSTTTDTKSTGTEIDRILRADKSMLTNSPVHLDKFLMTKRACLRSMQTNTAGTVMLDMAVTAKIVGDHKATSTTPLVTVDQSTCTAGENTQDTQIAMLSSIGYEKSPATLSRTSDPNQHRAYLVNASDVHLLQCTTDASVQMAPEMFATCTNMTVAVFDSARCAENSLLMREVGTNTSSLDGDSTGLRRTIVETKDASTSTSMTQSLFLETSKNTSISEEKNEGQLFSAAVGIGINATDLEEKGEGSCEILPATVKFGTTTDILQDENERFCQRLPTLEIRSNRAILDEKMEGFRQCLPKAEGVGTNTAIPVETSKGLIKIRPQTLMIRKIDMSLATAERGIKCTKDRSNWDTSTTFRTHSSSVGMINGSTVSKDVSPDFRAKDEKRNTAVLSHAATRRQTRVTVSRGTTTSRLTTTEKETWTDDIPTSRRCTIDRGSSPVRFAGIDKAVSASRGEIAEPVDKFQAPGKHMKLLQTITTGPKLDAICEDSNESSSDEEQSQQTVLPALHRQRPSMSWDDRKGGLLTHRERFAPSLGPKLHGRPTSSTFSVEGRRSACSIVWKVEMGTNTSNVEVEDKAIGTDSLTVDSKMAECINKLKTVSQRLESKQTTSTSTSTSNNTSRESGEMTNSSASETMTVERHSSVLPFSSPPEQSELPEKPQRNRTTFHSRVPKQRRSYAAGQDSSLSESSDQEPSSPVVTERRLPWKDGPTLARKKRFDMNEMLRNSAASLKTRSPKIGRKPPP